MAQKREKEETELKVPETLTAYSPAIPSPLSVPVDQTAGSPPESPDLKLSAVVERKYKPERSKSPSERSDLKHSGTGDRELMPAILPERSDMPLSGSPPESLDRKVYGAGVRGTAAERREVSRCSGCRRKVGLMGFRCRCGEMFCSEHRYSDRHDCSFDYKAAGREAIARENPMVRAAKILKV